MERKKRTRAAGRDRGHSDPLAATFPREACVQCDDQMVQEPEGWPIDRRGCWTDQTAYGGDEGRSGGSVPLIDGAVKRSENYPPNPPHTRYVGLRYKSW